MSSYEYDSGLSFRVKFYLSQVVKTNLYIQIFSIWEKNIWLRKWVEVLPMSTLIRMNIDSSKQNKDTNQLH